MYPEEEGWWFNQNEVDFLRQLTVHALKNLQGNEWSEWAKDHELEKQSLNDFFHKLEL